MAEPKKIHIDELRVGMFITKLDRDWLDTPFLLQGFVVEDRDDIDVVAEFCEYLWVDETKKAQRHSFDSAVIRASRRETPQTQTSIYKEHRSMVRAFSAARIESKSMLNNIRFGNAINTQNARATVKQCVDSIIRHPDALLWMARIRESQEYTAEHCLNVSILAIAFGRHLGFDRQELEQIGLCGLLHDVGKMRVPLDIINKPEALTDKEMKMMRSHTVHGRNLLMSTPDLMHGVIDSAYCHHERLDGTGYPRKLKAQNISRITRIITIVDAYDAMTADRVYDKAKTTTEALKIIYDNRGTQFDDELALEFIKTIGLYPAGCIVELSAGYVGIVIECNPKARHLPVVLVVLDKEKKPMPKYREVNLLDIKSGRVPKHFLVKKEWKNGTFGLFTRDFQDYFLNAKS